MARYMPFVIGALVAVCTACVFGCFSVGGVPGRSVPTSAGARQVSVAGMKEGLLAFSRRLGEMVPQQISGNSVVRRYVMEIPFDGGDYVTKLGMLLCADAACGLVGKDGGEPFIVKDDGNVRKLPFEGGYERRDVAHVCRIRVVHLFRMPDNKKFDGFMRNILLQELEQGMRGNSLQPCRNNACRVADSNPRPFGPVVYG